MKRKLVKNLSANTLQLIINQLFGLIIFYILSVCICKNSFGQIAWSRIQIIFFHNN